MEVKNQFFCSRRSLLLLILVAAVTGSGCVRTSTVPISSTSPRTSTGASQESNEIMTNQGDLFLREIKRASSEFHLKNLKEVTLTDSSTELRIWVGFDLTYPRCFILRKKNTERHASFISARLKDGTAETNAKGRIVGRQTILNPPKSGWREFEAFLQEQSAYYPAKFSLDETHTSHPDETYIALEAKSGNSYSMTFFPILTESKDGERLIQVCQRVEREFNIDMGCK